MKSVTIMLYSELVREQTELLQYIDSGEPITNELSRRYHDLETELDRRNSET